MRDTFYATTTALLDDDPRTALVVADISADPLAPAARRHPERVINVGIREQLMISVTGGLALTGMRPIAHSYAPFLVERAWEQVKLDLSHQGAGAILVSVGASYDSSQAGRTHHSPGDVALIDTLDSWTVHVPGHPDEVGPLIRAAARHDNPVYIRLTTARNDRPHATDQSVTALRTGSKAIVVAVGPTLDAVLAATADLDVTVAYTHTPRPFDADGLRSLLWDLPGTAKGAAVILVEPYLAGTSARVAAQALADVPHRLLCLGVGRVDLHRYGTTADHDAAHGLDAAGLRRDITRHIDPPTAR